jgi:hypothetical protein
MLVGISLYIPHGMFQNILAPRTFPERKNPASLAYLGEGEEAFPPNPALLLGEWLYWHLILT